MPNVSSGLPRNGIWPKHADTSPEPEMVEAGEKTVLECAERLGVSGVITAAKADVLERCRLSTPVMTVRRYMAPEWMEEA